LTSTTLNAASTVSAAADWTAPTVTLRNPGTPLKDTVTLIADATDAETGVATVTIQYLAPGAGSWTTVCTTGVSPYSCAWSTKLVADGTYSLRAIATDNAGYATTSAPMQTTVANNLLVVLASPADIVKGTVPLTASLYNAGAVSWSVSIQYAVLGTTTWRNICTVAAAPYTCSWNTASGTFTQGESYDLRAVASAGSTTTTSAVVTDTLIDNVAPSVTIQDPGTPLRGTVSLTATASDAESGISDVSIQALRNGTSTWTTLCTLSIDPYTCRYDTSQLVDGTWSFRALATDLAANTTTSAVIGSRVVDNTVSSVSMEDPGAYLNGITTLTATATSTAGVTSVRIDWAPSGTSTWTTVCTDTVSPYSCSLDTTKVADGLYDFRAVLLDGTGKTTTSVTVSTRRVDNNPLRGYDVQTVSGGAAAGKLDAGDVLRLTYTDQVNLSTITAGWSGSSLPVTVRLRDGNLFGLGSKGDTVDVLRNGVAVNLGSVNLKQDYVKSSKTVTFNATMVATTSTVNGVTSTVVTLTLGTLASGGGLRTAAGTATMVWTPSASVTDLNGRPSSSAPTSELGVLDREF
jgi:hypothetical protein